MGSISHSGFWGDPASLVPKQIGLPITKGGDGITDPRPVANAAFLGSWALWFKPWKLSLSLSLSLVQRASVPAMAGVAGGVGRGELVGAHWRDRR